jgi:hypothetical protein
MTKQAPAKSTKSRRRKPAKTKPARPVIADPDEELYEIRGILEEKYDGSRLLYKVDWADNPTTGERYDPSWVCLFIVPIPNVYSQPLIMSLLRRY